ncbi:MAG: hypothetical protein ABSD75_08605 [Terriglobales bacterium]|jgi:hypothetical protein
MDDLDALARLTERLERLESRVSVLEQGSEKTATLTAEPATPADQDRAASAFSFAQAGGVFPVLGKAMLGIAGAYLLRAVAESGSFPKIAVVVLALGYAAMWLVGAVRVPNDAHFTSTVYATTSALILAPMLWELTLRFEVLPTAATAAVLGGFAAAAYALAWKRDLASVVWVINVAAILTSLILLTATRDPVPFILALLLMALASELAALGNRWLRLRPLVAAAADLAIWILLYICSRPEGIPSEYKAIATASLPALGCMLFLVYGASTAFRTMRLREKIRWFEIGQTVVVSLLAALCVLSFSTSARAPRVGLLLGAICLLLSAGCYAAAYSYFDRFPEQRNYHVYAIWGTAFLLAGGCFCLPPLPLAFCLSAAAIVATFWGVRTSRLTLEFHGLAYLAVAAYASGLLEYAGLALAGTFPTAPGWIVWIVAASAVTCYAVGGYYRADRWSQRLLQLLAASLATAAMITFLVSVLVWLAALGMTAGASQVAVIRTLITCLAALALAFGGSRWQRIELVRIAYGILALVTAKLLLEDLHHGKPGSTAVSIFLYAVALILVPRMVRVGRRPTGEIAIMVSTVKQGR